MDLVNAVVATGTPVIAVLLHGRPLAIPELAAAVPAVVSAWFGGQQQGQGIADVLTGAYNPAGRTPMSWPISVGDLPVFYNVKPSASKTGCYYTGCDGGRLWPFGHGLSYTRFNYSNLVVTPASGIVGPTDTLVINVTVTNTGSLDGEDVPQLYVRDVVASTTQPIKQLKGFERVFVPAGASVEVSYTLLPERDLYIIDRSYARVVEPGDFIFWVAPSSALALPVTVNGTFAVATADDTPFAVRMGPLADLRSEVAALSTVAAAAAEQ
jgi:beta-glucosidase